MKYQTKVEKDYSNVHDRTEQENAIDCSHLFTFTRHYNWEGLAKEERMMNGTTTQLVM